MRILVISDLHLLPHFIVKKYNFLRELFLSVDKIVVNGDLWSFMYNPFSDFVSSEWSKLFPLMLQKDTVYLHGNHDCSHWCDHRVNLFSKLQAEKYIVKNSKTTFLIEHGHRIVNNNRTPYIPLVNLKRKLHFEKLRYFVEERTCPKTSTWAWFKTLNSKMRKYALENCKENEILVTGHTHIPEFNLENNFINEGLVNFGFAHFLLIEQDSFKLVKEVY